ncbi:MAG TPA: 50S ribosomal protein L29 [Acidimicrobiales bacterium]|jgi:large subunit ribosomal protein L29|nr:50S ribosomal protein L29 [Acidimicrobiales bacterium]
MTKVTEFAALGDEELLHRLADARKELFNLRFQFATGQLDSSAHLSQVRRDIARMLTVLREREIAAHEALTGSAT